MGVPIWKASLHSVKKKNTYQQWFKAANRMWKSHWTADVLLLLVALIWGTTYAATKSVVDTVPVLQFLFIRFTLTVLFMIPFTFHAIRTANRSTWINGGIFGLLLFAIFMLETFGVAYTTASNAGFIISLCVVLVPIIDSVIYRKLPKLSLLGAVFISILGTALLTLKGGYGFNTGDVLILGAAICRAIHMTITKKLTEGKKLDSGALTTIQLFVVAIGAGGFSIFQHPISVPSTYSFWFTTGYLVIFATIFAFYIQLTMIRRTSPSRVALLLSSEPLFAAIFSILIMGEHLSVLSITGGILIISGMLWGRRLQL